MCEPHGPAPVAQRIEHLTTDQKVRGSNPFGRANEAPGCSYPPLTWGFVLPWRPLANHSSPVGRAAITATEWTANRGIKLPP